MEQRFGLSNLIGALREEPSSSLFSESSCLVSSCGSTFLINLLSHTFRFKYFVPLHLALLLLTSTDW